MTDVRLHEGPSPTSSDPDRAVPAPGSAAAVAFAEVQAEAKLVGAIRAELGETGALATPATPAATPRHGRTPRFDERTWTLIRSAGLGVALAGTIAFGWQLVS